MTSNKKAWFVLIKSPLGYLSPCVIYSENEPSPIKAEGQLNWEGSPREVPEHLFGKKLDEIKAYFDQK